MSLGIRGGNLFFYWRKEYATYWRKNYFGALHCVFWNCSHEPCEIGKEYYDGQKEYEELKEYTEEEPNGQQDDPTEGEAEEKTIDFAELRKINEDIVAWIQISGIGVDYPVVQGEDNEYYLHHTFRKEANKAGSIFLDYRNRADFTEQRVIIYGHNMKDGSMFSNLKKYQDNAFRKESGTAYLYLPEKTLQLEIVACERVSMRDKAYALEYNMTCDWPEEIILSTCSSFSDTRLILRCRMEEVQFR